jgi:hypothetical protein
VKTSDVIGCMHKVKQTSGNDGMIGWLHHLLGLACGKEESPMSQAVRKHELRPYQAVQVVRMQPATRIVVLLLLFLVISLN